VLRPQAQSPSRNHQSRHQENGQKRPHQRQSAAPCRPPVREVSIDSGESKQESQTKNRSGGQETKYDCPAHSHGARSRGSPQEQSGACGLHQEHRREEDEVRQVPDIQERTKHLSSLSAAGSHRYN
jgi:hypothetical protein